MWSGACLLADWALANAGQLRGQVVTELGAGVGLVSLFAALAASTVFLTDGAPGALQLAARNAAERGAGDARLPGDVRVRRLDWLALFDVALPALAGRDDELLAALNATAGGGHPQQPQQPPCPAWRAGDLPLLAATSVWLAADVVYDEALTDACLRTAAALMRWQRRRTGSSPCDARLLVALEKRYVFTLRDADAVAPAFQHFLSYLRLPGQPSRGDDGALFVGRRLDAAAVLRALQTDRGPDDCLELWQLTLLPDEGEA